MKNGLKVALDLDKQLPQGVEHVPLTFCTTIASRCLAACIVEL